jgi:hypothetical protein
MLVSGEAEKGAIRPDFNSSIFIDFAGAKITSNAGVLLMQEIDRQFGIISSRPVTCSSLARGALARPRFPARQRWPWLTPAEKNASGQHGPGIQSECCV